MRLKSLHVKLLFLSGLLFLRPIPLQAQSIDPVEGRAKLAAGALVVDVRTPEEFAEGHVEGAKNIPYDNLEERLGEFGENKEREIILYCKVGRRAGYTQERLKKEGYKNVFNGGGFEAWNTGSK